MNRESKSSSEAGVELNPLEMLHNHHEKLIGTIMSLADRSVIDPADSSLLLAYCGENLLPHAEAEESTLYSAASEKEFVGDMMMEHRDLKRELEMIVRSLATGDHDGILTGVRQFRSLLSSHFDEEENRLMPALEKELSAAQFLSLIELTHKAESEKRKSDLTALFGLDHKRIDMNISAVVDDGTAAQDVKSRYDRYRKQLLKHIELEEAVLFPAYEEYNTSGAAGPVQVMIAEHREIASIISNSSEGMNAPDIVEATRTLVGRLALHNKKEELILYPLIGRTLSGKEKSTVFRECFEKFREA